MVAALSLFESEMHRFSSLIGFTEYPITLIEPMLLIGLKNRKESAYFSFVASSKLMNMKRA